MQPEVLALLLLVVVTVYTELKEGKIYNWLTLPAIGLGLFLALLQGWDQFLGSVWGMLIGGGIFLFPYLLSGLATGRPVIGGGDVKFIAAVGALTGIFFTLQVIYYAVLIGVVFGILTVAWYRIRAWRRPAEEEPQGGKPSLWSMRVPFGTALSVAVVLTIKDFYFL